MMIMKTKLVFLSGLLAAATACSAKHVTLVPEVSPPLVQEEVFAWTGQVAGNMLFTCAEGIGWVDVSGQIATWDPEKKVAGRTFPLPFPVNEPPFRQGDFLALKNQAADRLLVFDLARMETRFALEDLRVTQVLAVAGDCLVYLEGETLVVYSWQQPAGIFRWPTAEKKFFNCHFFPDRIVIMGSRQLFVFWRGSGKFQTLPLPVEAAGEFLCQTDAVYYGSSQRQLVKYSLRKNRLAWQMKLGQKLTRQPLLAGGTLVVSPVDNNVIQLNRRGSVRWWSALNSILQFDLVPMTDHMAAFLLNQEIRFIDFSRRQETIFKITGRPSGQPLGYKQDLYFFLAGEKMQKLQRVGNRYGIELTLAPDQGQWLGEPVMFSIQTSNLLSPRLSAVIRDGAGQKVLTKDFGMIGRAGLVWIPARAGMHSLQVSAAALNRNAEKEISFQVFDPQQIIPEFYFHF